MNDLITQCPNDLSCFELSPFSFELYAMLYALCALLFIDWANFFRNDLAYRLCSTLLGLKQEMRPPVLHIRYPMPGEAAIQHIFAVLRTTEPDFENLSTASRT